MIEVEGINLKPLVEIVIEKELQETPLEGNAEHFMKAGEKYQIDPLFLLAIQYHESKYCKAYTKETNESRHNCAGIMAFNDGIRSIKKYSSYEEFIYDHARIIRTGYLDTGRTTVNQIWARYAPSNEAMNSSWGPQVAKKYSSLLSNFGV